MEKANEFSVPMPFEKSHISQIAQINKEVSHSKIRYMYNTLTRNAADLCGFEQARVTDERIHCMKDMLPYIDAVHEAGCDFIFLLNSPRVMDEAEFAVREGKLRRILDTLISEGVYDIRVCNPLIIDYLAHEYPQISIRCSTSQEYFSVKQYQKLLFLYPQIVEVVPSWEKNRDFVFLSALNQHRNLSVELMVNEGCLSGCPFRVYHSMFSPSKKDCKYDRFSSFFKSGCEKNFYHNLWESICMSNIIYPWQIFAYHDIGIYNFKLVGRNTTSFQKGSYISIYRDYLLGVENISLIKDIPFSYFSNYLMGHPALRGITVSDVLEMLPDIRYFQKKHISCDAQCGVTCKYCKELAQKLQRKFPV